MDETTRLAAKRKAEAVSEKVGFPDFIMDAGALDEYYAGISECVGSGHVSDILCASKYYGSKSLKKLGQPVDKSEWHMNAHEVNAYYSPAVNEIVFPAGILQAPFFDADLPDAANYGGIGVVVGHELTHGFDDQGSKYDLHGELLDWWTPAVRSAFKSKTQCIVDQYSNYVMMTDQGKENVNGELTLGENLADNGGMKQAFNAYLGKMAMRRKSRDARPLEGLPYTNDQLFFISFASVWCGDTRPQGRHAALLTDVHSPGSVRVAGTVSNSGDFCKSVSMQARNGYESGKKSALCGDAQLAKRYIHLIITHHLPANGFSALSLKLSFVFDVRLLDGRPC